MINKIIESLKDNSNNLNVLKDYSIYDTEFFWGGGAMVYQDPMAILGDNSVVVKMRDEQYEEFAFKCYFQELSGREERYNLIKKTIKSNKSKYFFDVEFYPSELSVDGCGKLDVCKTKWLDAVDLYTYIDTYIHDQFELKLLAYNFCEFAKWLLEMPFAHGSICTDNVMVNSNGDIFLTDYDNMYTPEMEGLSTKKLGDKNFIHPELTVQDFCKTIDNVPLLIVLLSLEVISIYPELYNSKSKDNHYLFTLNDIVNLPTLLPCDILDKKNIDIRKTYCLLMSALGDKEIVLSLKQLTISNPVFEDNKRITIKYGDGHFNMVYVEPGWYHRGATSNLEEARKYGSNDEDSIIPSTFDIEAEIDEAPIRYEGTNGFWISESFIKNSVHKIRCYGENGYYQPLNWSSLNWPIMAVQYDEAVQIAKELSQAFGLFFDLPSESEWEFAAKGGIYTNHYKYSGSNNINEVAVHSLPENVHLSTCPLKTKKPNELGIYDMSGLLYEWCKDEYAPKSFKTFEEPVWRHLRKDQKFHVRRGGCMKSDPHECRTTTRRRENIFELHDDDGYIVDSLDYFDPNTGNYIDDSYFHHYTGLRLILKNKNPDSIKGLISPYEISIGNRETYKDEFNSILTTDNKLFVSCDDEIVDLKIKKGIEVLAQGCCQEKENLRSVKLPRTVKKICGQSFWGCSSLETIELGPEIFSIENQAFWGCKNLKQVTLPYNLRFMSYGSFSGCSSLKEVTIPNSMEELGDNNFSFCDSLEKITIPNRIRTIPANFLWRCSSLKELTIPASVDEIEGNPFRESGIRRINCQSSHFVFENGFLMTNDKKRLLACLTDENRVTVPDGVEIIGQEAFAGLKTLRTIHLPNGLKYIERSAFSDCKSLRSIFIPSTVKYIQECVYGCEKLEEITLHCPYSSVSNFSIYGTAVSDIYVMKDIDKFTQKFGSDKVKLRVEKNSNEDDDYLPF